MIYKIVNSAHVETISLHDINLVLRTKNVVETASSLVGGCCCLKLQMSGYPRIDCRLEQSIPDCNQE